MSDALFSALEANATLAPGYRLHHLEMLNWGTFNEKIWRFVPGAETALLTGDIGSGKSTIVDGITTLLLPANQIAYNRAAGADTRERTLRSYVEGYYRSERGPDSHHSRTRGLREGRSSYSVLLAVFVNGSLGETVTLAQVFQQRDQTGQPYRFYVACKDELSIADDFTDFGTSLNDLRKRLRGRDIPLFDDYPKYGTALRRLLGIPSEQALELFHQTVSMKSVGNLNDFVREHMLEPSPADEHVKGIIAHFEDLTTAHDAVVRAREQLDELAKVADAASRYDAALDARREFETQRVATVPYVSELRLALLDAELAHLDGTLDRLDSRKTDLTTRLAQLAAEHDRLTERKAQAGGNRLGELERLEREASSEADQRRARRGEFDAQVAAAGQDPVTDAESLRDLLARASEQEADLDARRRGLSHDIAEQIALDKEHGKRAEELSAELDDLQGRTSNLPREQVQLRAQLCEALGLAEEELPFAGELMDVADEHREWRGAAERVLRGFALSMLVRDEHYVAVSRWVNQHRLTYDDSEGRRRGARLVYEKVPSRVHPAQPDEHGRLYDVLTLREGAFEAYLRRQLIERANHYLADSLDDFRSTEHRYAVTREGQVRAGQRHEKDDRFRVDDPRRFVLGWVNEQKVAALAADLAEARDLQQASRAKADDLQRMQEDVLQRQRAWHSVSQYRTWSDLDHEEATARAQRYRDERRRIEQGSSELAEIQKALDDVAEQRASANGERDQVTGELARTRGVRETKTAQRDQDAELLRVFDEQQLQRARAAYPALDERVRARRPATSEGCQALRQTLTDELTSAIEAKSKDAERVVNQLTSFMNTVLNRWSELRADMDARVEARGEFLALRRRLAEDDLPRFEGEFKHLLNQNAIQELAQFNNWLGREAAKIDERISRINEALNAVPYDAGTYLRLDKEPTANQEVIQFRGELRDLTDDALSGDQDTYSEQRFVAVKRIIERFRGREGHADADRTWTSRVTDVRNWFEFSASERYADTDEEREHYSDSDGKSGGQKEKLAYTILAASLAYQFGLDWGAPQSRSFQFAVIDEAFGRGSDASTRYALDLFAKLGLQLLIVTPLQKVHIIEPYVHAIGFVDNVQGANSRVHTLTIDEYHAKKTDQARRAAR